MKTITPQDTLKALQNDEAILIDVREQDEYDAYYINEACLVPLSILPQAIQDIHFEAVKDKKIIFHCLKGGRSAQAIDYLQQNILSDYDVYNMDGGILAWIEDCLPVENS